MDIFIDFTHINLSFSTLYAQTFDAISVNFDKFFSEIQRPEALTVFEDICEFTTDDLNNMPFVEMPERSIRPRMQHTSLSESLDPKPWFTWRYTHPRVLTRVCTLPLPSVGFTGRPLQGTCDLQYYDVLREIYITATQIHFGQSPQWFVLQDCPSAEEWRLTWADALPDTSILPEAFPSSLIVHSRSQLAHLFPQSVLRINCDRVDVSLMLPEVHAPKGLIQERVKDPNQQRLRPDFVIMQKYGGQSLRCGLECLRDVEVVSLVGRNVKIGMFNVQNGNNEILVSLTAEAFLQNLKHMSQEPLIDPSDLIISMQYYGGNGYKSFIPESRVVSKLGIWSRQFEEHLSLRETSLLTSSSREYSVSLRCSQPKTTNPKLSLYTPPIYGTKLSLKTPDIRLNMTENALFVFSRLGKCVVTVPYAGPVLDPLGVVKIDGARAVVRMLENNKIATRQQQAISAPSSLPSLTRLSYPTLLGDSLPPTPHVSTHALFSFYTIENLCGVDVWVRQEGTKERVRVASGEGPIGYAWKNLMSDESLGFSLTGDRSNPYSEVLGARQWHWSDPVHVPSSLGSTVGRFLKSPVGFNTTLVINVQKRDLQVNITILPTLFLRNFLLHSTLIEFQPNTVLLPPSALHPASSDLSESSINLDHSPVIAKIPPCGDDKETPCLSNLSLYTLSLNTLGVPVLCAVDDPIKTRVYIDNPCVDVTPSFPVWSETFMSRISGMPTSAFKLGGKEKHSSDSLTRLISIPKTGQSFWATLSSLPIKGQGATSCALSLYPTFLLSNHTNFALEAEASVEQHAHSMLQPMDSSSLFLPPFCHSSVGVNGFRVFVRALPPIANSIDGGGEPGQSGEQMATVPKQGVDIPRPLEPLGSIGSTLVRQSLSARTQLLLSHPHNPDTNTLLSIRTECASSIFTSNAASASASGSGSSIATRNKLGDIGAFVSSHYLFHHANNLVPTCKIIVHSPCYISNETGVDLFIGRRAPENTVTFAGLTVSVPAGLGGFARGPSGLSDSKSNPQSFMLVKNGSNVAVPWSESDLTAKKVQFCLGVPVRKQSVDQGSVELENEEQGQSLEKVVEKYEDEDSSLMHGFVEFDQRLVRYPYSIVWSLNTTTARIKQESDVTFSVPLSSVSSLLQFSVSFTRSDHSTLIAIRPRFKVSNQTGFELSLLSNANKLPFVLPPGQSYSLLDLAPKIDSKTQREAETQVSFGLSLDGQPYPSPLLLPSAPLDDSEKIGELAEKLDLLSDPESQLRWLVKVPRHELIPQVAGSNPASGIQSFSGPVWSLLSCTSENLSGVKSRVLSVYKDSDPPFVIANECPFEISFCAPHVRSSTQKNKEYGLGPNEWTEFDFLSKNQPRVKDYNDAEGSEGDEEGEEEESAQAKEKKVLKFKAPGLSWSKEISPEWGSNHRLVMETIVQPSALSHSQNISGLKIRVSVCGVTRLVVISPIWRLQNEKEPIPAFLQHYLKTEELNSHEDLLSIPLSACRAFFPTAPAIRQWTTFTDQIIDLSIETLGISIWNGVEGGRGLQQEVLNCTLSGLEVMNGDSKVLVDPLDPSVPTWISNRLHLSAKRTAMAELKGESLPLTVPDKADPWDSKWRTQTLFSLDVKLNSIQMDNVMSDGLGHRFAVVLHSDNLKTDGESTGSGDISRLASRLQRTTSTILGTNAPLQPSQPQLGRSDVTKPFVVVSALLLGDGYFRRAEVSDVLFALNLDDAMLGCLQSIYSRVFREHRTSTSHPHSSPLTLTPSPSSLPPFLLLTPSQPSTATTIQPPRVLLFSLSMGMIQMILSANLSVPVVLCVDQSPTRVAALTRSLDSELTWVALRDLVVDHYVESAIFAAPVVVGSLEVLLNPTGFVRAVSSGVRDLVTLPMEGFRTRNADEIMRGLKTGGASLALNVADWALSTFSGFSLSVSRSLDMLTAPSQTSAYVPLSTSSRKFGGGTSAATRSVSGGASVGLSERPSEIGSVMGEDLVSQADGQERIGGLAPNSIFAKLGTFLTNRLDTFAQQQQQHQASVAAASSSTSQIQRSPSISNVTLSSQALSLHNQQASAPSRAPGSRPHRSGSISSRDSTIITTESHTREKLSISNGFQRLKSDVVTGVKGLVHEPISGAKESGASGFIKGVGRGLLGAVTKPIGGAFGFVSSVSQEIHASVIPADLSSPVLPVREQREHMLRQFGKCTLVHSPCDNSERVITPTSPAHPEIEQEGEGGSSSSGVNLVLSEPTTLAVRTDESEKSEKSIATTDDILAQLENEMVQLHSEMRAEQQAQQMTRPEEEEVEGFENRGKYLSHFQVTWLTQQDRTLCVLVLTTRSVHLVDFSPLESYEDFEQDVSRTRPQHLKCVELSALLPAETVEGDPLILTLPIAHESGQERTVYLAFENVQDRKTVQHEIEMWRHRMMAE